jgi:hypothetical protein
LKQLQELAVVAADSVVVALVAVYQFEIGDLKFSDLVLDLYQHSVT